MADRDFNTQDILPSGITLNIPPHLDESGQLSESVHTTTRRIASVHVHVERAIECIKNYLPNSMHNRVNQIFFICSILTKFLPPLVN